MGVALLSQGQTPLRSSASSQSGNCYACGQSGHWSSSCPSPGRGSATTTSQTPSSDKCFSCGQTGHRSNNCSRHRQGSATPSRSTSGDKCFSCGKICHWSSNCPTRRNRWRLTSRRDGSGDKRGNACSGQWELDLINCQTLAETESRDGNESPMSVTIK